MGSIRTRRRLSPAARTDQLLDTARQMIVQHGLQGFTMEALARAAGVSSPLVYNYFSSRKRLLQELLEREYQLYADQLNAQVAAASTFQEVVRVFVASNFDHHAEGNILPTLLSQPEIAGVIASRREEYGKQTARFLVRNAARSYRLSKTQAELVVRMSSGASIAAAEYAAALKADRDETIDAALAYIMAGLNRVAGQVE